VTTAKSKTDDELRARILASAAAKPSMTRHRAREVGLGLTAATVAISVVIFEGIGGMSHSASRPLGVSVALGGGWAVVSTLLTWLVLGRGGSSLSRRPLWLAGAIVLTPLLLFGWMQLFYGTYEEPFSRLGYRCFAYTVLISATPLAVFFALRRGVEPRFPALLGAAAGAACAAWAGALVDLWCPLTNPRHVLFGHIAPLLAAMAVGAVVGRWLLGLQRHEGSR